MARSLKSMPGPRAWPIFGSTLEYTKFGPHSFEQMHVAKKENCARYGCIYQERLGPGLTVVQLFDPDDIARVLRADGKYPLRPALPIVGVANRRDNIPVGLGSLNGEKWYQLRSTVHKLMMKPGAASVYLPVQNAVADDFVNMIADEVNSEGYVPDFQDMITKYAMESIGAVCFNTRLGCLQKKPPKQAERMLEGSQEMFNAIQNTTFAFPWYAMMRTKLYKQFTHGYKTCSNISKAHIESINTEPDESMKGCPHFFSSLLEVPNIDLDSIMGLTSELFTAGIDSTANALSFVLYNISRHPDKQAALIEEIQRVIPNNKHVTSKHLESMRYLKACVKESFRINFPIEGGTTRILTKELQLSGYTVPKKVMVAFNNQTMCMQEKYFESPHEYRPERWLKAEDGSTPPLPRYVMLPFGYGSRMCIGRRFAEQEIYLALARIFQNFRTEYHGGEIGMINSVFTVPDQPIAIRFSKL